MRKGLAPRVSRLLRGLPSWAILTVVAAGPFFTMPLAQIQARERASDAATVEALVAQADDMVRRGQIFEAISTLEKAVEGAPGRLDIRLRLAALERQRGIWARGAEQYRAVLAADPGNSVARVGYAELLLASYQFPAAAAEFQRAVDSVQDPMDRDRSLVGLGSARFAMGDYGAAADTFRLILSRKPEEPTALAYLSISLRKMGDLDGAIEGWRRFLQRQPGTTRARIHLVEAEELRTAIARQKQAVAAQPRDAVAQARLGDLLADQPDLGGAIQAYRASLDAKGDASRVRFRLGLALRDAGRFEEAAAEFRALSSEPAFASLAGYNLAFCAARLHNTDLEVTAWLAVLRSHPRDAYAYRRYLAALSRAGGLEREIADLLRAVKERPGDPLVRIRYAVLMVGAGRKDEGCRALLDALAIEPNDPYAQSELRAALALDRAAADLLAREVAEAASSGADARVSALRQAALSLAVGRPKEAAARLEEIVKGPPRDARAVVALALSRRSAGAGPAEVTSLLEEAREIDPGYFYARLDLAMTYEALFRFEDSAREAEAALRLVPDSAHALAILGAALREGGNPSKLESAQAALRRALEIDPHDSTGAARLLLARTTWELGQEREARAVLKGELPVEPEEMYLTAWEFVRDNYRDRTFNGQDWTSWRDRYLGKLETPADAQAAMAMMLSSLDNPDTRLRSADQTANMFYTARSSRIERDSLGRSTMESRTVETAKLDGNLGYIAISNMADPKLVKEVESAVSRMKESDGVILDLRGNQGGFERDADSIAAMLVHPGTPTGKVITSSGAMLEVSRGKEPPLIPDDKPVVVLVDRNTGSSAEALAGALKESSRAVIVGERTYGKAGIQFPKILPDGTTLLVAAGENADLSGESYSGVGITPDVPLDGALPSLDRASDAAIQKARELLDRERARRQRAGPKAPGR